MHSKASSWQNQQKRCTNCMLLSPLKKWCCRWECASFGMNCWYVLKHFKDFTPRAHVCCVSDVCGVHGMERNIGDQLNKAFEAYRQVSIEKDNAKKELQQMVPTWGQEHCVKWAKYYQYSTNYKSHSSLQVLHWKCACLFNLCQQSYTKK